MVDRIRLSLVLVGFIAVQQKLKLPAVFATPLYVTATWNH